LEKGTIITTLADFGGAGSSEPSMGTMGGSGGVVAGFWPVMGGGGAPPRVSGQKEHEGGTGKKNYKYRVGGGIGGVRGAVKWGSV